MLRFFSLVWERITHPRVPCEDSVLSSHELLPSRRKTNCRPLSKGFVTYSQINANRLSVLKLYLCIHVEGAEWEGTGIVSIMALYKSQRTTCRRNLRSLSSMRISGVKLRPSAMWTTMLTC